MSFEWLKRIRNYPDMKMNLNYANQRMKDLQDSNDELQTKLITMQDKLDASQATIDSMQAVYEQRLHQQANEVRSLKNKAQKPKRNRLSHKEKAELYKRFQKEKATWKAENFKLKEEIKELNDKATNLHIENAKLRVELDTVKQQLKYSEGNVDQLLEEKKSLENIIAGMEEKHDDNN